MRLYSGTEQFKVYLQGQAYRIRNSRLPSTQAQDIMLANNVVVGITFDPEADEYRFNMDEPFQLIWTSSTSKLHWGYPNVDRYALQGGQTLSFYAIDLYQYIDVDEYQDLEDPKQEASFIEQHGEYLGSIKLRGDDTWKVV